MTAVGWNADRAADAIRDWVKVDSNVEVDRFALVVALLTDFGSIGRYPDRAECEVLVTGGEDGSIPPDLAAAFPQTHELLDSYMT